MCSVATAAWLRYHGAYNLAERDEAQLDHSTEVEMGKRNIIYRLRMPDGMTWIARLRNNMAANSTVTDPDLLAKNECLLLESEVATMAYVRKHTRIPVPEIYASDATSNNELGVPYVLMECIHGKPFPFPFSRRSWASDSDILKIHMQLVNFSHELTKLPFKSIGQLRFSPESPGNIFVGPIIDRAGRAYGPFHSSQEFYQKRAQIVHNDEAQTKLRHSASSHDRELAEDHVGSALLHVEAAHMIGRSHFDKGPFLLKHVDLHWQNILLDSECVVVGIIDWEWAHTVPAESFRPLPFNFAGKLQPLNQWNIERHAEIAQAIFRLLETNDSQCIQGLASLDGTANNKIAACLDCYKWPEIRREHYKRLQSLLESLDWGRDGL